MTPDKALLFDMKVSVKRLFGLNNGGGMLDAGSEGNPGISISDIRLLNLAGSDMITGKYAVREKNLAEVVTAI